MDTTISLLVVLLGVVCWGLGANLVQGVHLHHGHGSGGALQELVIETGKKGCPFASGLQFYTNGAAPSFMEQDQFRTPFVACAKGICNNTHGKQTLDTTTTANCTDKPPPNGSKSCKELVRSWGGCKNVEQGFCELSCGKCSPVFVSKFARRSGTPYDINQGEEDELALGASFYLPKIPRKRCQPYNVSNVVDAARELFEKGYAGVATSVRIGFHDAADFDKWLGTGGADGRFLNGEDIYGQSRSLNAGNRCPLQLLERFKHSSLSAGDAIQLCGMVAAEFAGGPSFESFNFQPGRVKNVRGVTNDGMLPNPNGNADMLRDYFFRTGLNTVDIVALMGAHTLGGGAADGSGYTGVFTENDKVFDNTYYVNLLKYENSTDPQCDYFNMRPYQRGTNGGCHPDHAKLLLQLPTDRALLADSSMRKLVTLYASNQTAFFEQYSKSIKKMSELGKDVSVQWCDFA